MLLSKASEYAIRAVLGLVSTGGDGFTPVRVLAERTGISAFYLGKLCHQLTQAGLLESHKGPQGGVRLARPPERVTLLEIVEAIEGKRPWQGCILGLEPCGDERPCPIHFRWAPIREAIHTMLAERTVADLIADLRAGRTTLKRPEHP